MGACRDEEAPRPGIDLSIDCEKENCRKFLSVKNHPPFENAENVLLVAPFLTR